MAIGSHRLSQQVCEHVNTIIMMFIFCCNDTSRYLIQGAMALRMTAIEEMSGMDVLCSDKMSNLTLSKLSTEKI